MPWTAPPAPAPNELSEIRRSLAGDSLGIDDVNPTKPEVTAPGQQVTVVRVDLSESMLGRRPRVKGVTGAEDGEPRKSVHAIAHRAKQGRGHGQPTPHPSLLIGDEVIEH